MQCLELSTFTVKGVGWMHGWATKILQATWHSQKKTKSITYKINSFLCFSSVLYVFLGFYIF